MVEVVVLVLNFFLFINLDSSSILEDRCIDRKRGSEALMTSVVVLGLLVVVEVELFLLEDAAVF